MDRALIGDTPAGATLAAVRAAIARACLPHPPAAPHATPSEKNRLGALTLHPHQVDAVARLRAAIAEFGGALLADDVGLGKTYVALALAGGFERPLVVAPAALRDMWRQALATTGVHADLLSFESLSRGDARRARAARRPAVAPDFIVVDEAHHARTPRTRRYHALARLATSARVLLLSATPIHNRRADLDALLALFLGARARALDDATLARLVVRRDHASLDARDSLAMRGPDLGRIPEVTPPVRVALPIADDDLPDTLLSLPPPLPPADGGDGGALLAHSLVRLWASSDAALRAALRRRLARGHAITASLERGRHPTRAELAAWTTDGESLQLAFAELLAPAPSPPGELAGDEAEPSRTTAARLAAVRAHADAVRALLGRLRASGDLRDAARADLVATLCARHAGEKVVAFAACAETVDALFRCLRGRRRVGALTARGAAVAGGPLSRRELLARFAPLASRAPPPAAAERVDLLLATDLLSEGVNLQDASVVLHLDLPWTPARLAQRVGRVARLGSPHDHVTVYALAPPASAECLLRIERRLREKLRAAARAVGVADAILPAAFVSPRDAASLEREDAAAPAHAEAIRRMLARWLERHPCAPPTSPATSAVELRGDPLVVAVRTPVAGYLALCAPAAASAAFDEREPGARPPLLLASLGGAPPTDHPAVVRRVVELADGAVEASLVASDVRGAERAVREWVGRRLVADTVGLGDAVLARARRRIVERVAAVVRRAPPHRRAAVAALALAARQNALASRGAGGEWAMDRLADADLDDESWLRLVADTQAGDAKASAAPAGRSAELAIRALLLLVPPDSGELCREPAGAPRSRP